MRLNQHMMYSKPRSVGPHSQPARHSYNPPKPIKTKHSDSAFGHSPTGFRPSQLPPQGHNAMARPNQYPKAHSSKP